MKIATTKKGHAYVGYLDLMTNVEQRRYLVFNDIVGIARPIEKTVEERAKQLGGKEYKEKYFGMGFIFPNETTSSLEMRAMATFPELFD